MKLILATIYLLIAILSATFHAQIDSLGNSKNKAVAEFSDSSNCCNTDSTHQNVDSECDICHLGHSSTLGLNTMADVTEFSQSYPQLKIQQNLKNYHFVLLRPPIA